MDESRKQFESCFVMRYPRQSSLLQKNHDGNYVFSSTENQWYMWQASRAAIEVELYDGCCGSCCANVEYRIVNQLKTNGITVKE